MSAALKDALMTLMQSNAALGDLLARDPNDPQSVDLAVFQAKFSDLEAPTYPCITYREEGDVPDGRFRPQPAPPPGTRRTGVGETFFDLEAWTDSPNSRTLEDIRDALDTLFHQRAFPFTGGVVFFCERITGAIDNYNDDLHAWYGLMRYRFQIEYL